MINTKIYENIKKDLVNQVLEQYEAYKGTLNNFDEQVDTQEPYFMSNANRPISMYSSIDRFGKILKAKMDQNEQLEWELGNIREKLGYIKQFRKIYDQVVANRECLFNSINELKVFNKITKEKVLDKKDATALFSSIKNDKLNWYISGSISSIETIEIRVGKYLKEKRERYLEGIVLKEESEYKIQRERIVEKEKELFKQLKSAIHHDLKQVEKVESKKECENYLEYYLLFK